MNSFQLKLQDNHYTGASDLLITTERSESSYEQPVAVLIGGINAGVAYSGNEFVPTEDTESELSWLEATAKNIVAGALLELKKNNKINETPEIVAAFLSTPN